MNFFPTPHGLYHAYCLIMPRIMEQLLVWHMKAGIQCGASRFSQDSILGGLDTRSAGLTVTFKFSYTMCQIRQQKFQDLRV